MKTNLAPSLLAALILSSCAAPGPGVDPIVLDAQRTTELALNTFDLIEQADLQGYAAFKSVNPAAAASFRTFVNTIRANEKQWLQSARLATTAYQNASTSANASTLSKALAVLTNATSQAQKYLGQMNAAKPKT